MRQKTLILSVLAALAAVVAVCTYMASCTHDPSPDAFLVPEFGAVTVDESVPGSVEFNCQVSSMAQISEFGVYSSNNPGPQGSLQKIPGVLTSQDAFKVRLDGLMGGTTYSCRFFIGNGRVERLSEPITYSVPDNGSGRAPMVLRVKPAADGNVYLPLRGSVKCVVDWGDGKREACTGEYGSGTIVSGFISHSYAAASTYDITISGTVSALSSYGLPDCSCVCAVLDWGDTGLKDLGCAFQNQAALEELAAPGNGTFAEVSSFRNAFSGSAITAIPAGFFSSCPPGCDYTRVSFGCKDLETLPDVLFPSAESLQQCFKGCSSLRGLPAHLAASGASLKELQETFADCTSLTELPETLLQGCSCLERVVSAFAGCSSLTKLPAALFDDCHRLTSVEGAFMNCTALAGESPFTVVDGQIVHLYERSSRPQQFAGISKYYLCFYACEGLSDYMDMPATWKSL